MQNEMRDTLIDLLKKADENSARKCITDYEDAIIDNAEYLLANGVIAPSFKMGDTVYIVERDECGEAEDYTGYMFLAQTKNAVIVTSFINDYDSEETIEYLIQETIEKMDTDLCVFPLEDCYATKEEAEQKLKESEGYE